MLQKLKNLFKKKEPAVEPAPKKKIAKKHRGKLATARKAKK